MTHLMKAGPLSLALLEQKRHIKLWNAVERSWSLKPCWNLGSLLLPLISSQVPLYEELP